MFHHASNGCRFDWKLIVNALIQTNEISCQVVNYCPDEKMHERFFDVLKRAQFDGIVIRIARGEIAQSAW